MLSRTQQHSTLPLHFANAATILPPHSHAHCTCHTLPWSRSLRVVCQYLLLYTKPALWGGRCLGSRSAVTTAVRKCLHMHTQGYFFRFASWDCSLKHAILFPIGLNKAVPPLSPGPAISATNRKENLIDCYKIHLLSRSWQSLRLSAFCECASKGLQAFHLNAHRWMPG